MMRRTTQTIPVSITRFEALKLVVEAYGSHEAAGSALGVSQSTVSRWLSSSKQMPAEYVLRAEADTGISRHHLRPDIYPVDLPPAGRFYGVDYAAAGRDFTARTVLKDGRIVEVRTA